MTTAWLHQPPKPLPSICSPYPQKPSPDPQIPIGRASRSAEHKRPAVSSPEGCPTPADRVRASRPATADVRQPLTFHADTRLPPHPPLRTVANGGRAENLATVRELLALPQQQDEEQDTGANPGSRPMLAHPCPCCGGPMIIIETFERGARTTAPAQDWNLMMVRSQNPNAARPCRRFSTGPAPFYQIQPHAGPVSANQ